MRISADLILDVPYASYEVKKIQLTADNAGCLIRDVIPERTFREFEEFCKTGWTHVNMKFRFNDLEIEYVFDMEKSTIATIYLSRISTGELLSCSKAPIRFSGVSDLAAETEKRAEEAKVLPESEPIEMTER